MLLAKLKDKLFNNRNSVEIDSLEGDLNGISLQECLEWAELMREKVFFDEENEEVIIDYVAVFNDNVEFTGGLLSLSDGEDYLFPSGKVPSIWTATSGNTFDHIGNIDFDLVKNGDIIYSNDEHLSGVIENYVEDLSLTIKVLASNKVIFYYYQKDATTGWDYTSNSEVTLGGTKLYRHSISIEETGDNFVLITNSSTSLGSFLNLRTLASSLDFVHGIAISADYGLGNIVGTANVDADNFKVIYYDYAESGNIEIIVNDEYNIVDTITLL